MSLYPSGDRGRLSPGGNVDRPQAAQVPRAGQRRLLRTAPLLLWPRTLRPRARLGRVPVRRQGRRAEALRGE